MSPKMYISALVGAVSSIRSYVLVLSRPLSYSIIFFLVSCLILGLASAIQFNLTQVPVWETQIRAAATELQSRYPNDLVITWTGSQLSWQPSQSLTLPYPTSLEQTDLGLTSTLAYGIPTEVEVSNLVTTLPSESLLVVTPTRLLVNEGGGSWNQVEIKDLPGFERPFEITAQNLPQHLTDWQTRIDQTFGLGKQLVLIGGPLVYLASRLWASLLDSMIFYLLLHLYGLRLSWKKAWQLSLHMVIAASVLTWVANLLYPDLNLPLLTIATWVIFTYFILTLKSQLTYRQPV